MLTLERVDLDEGWVAAHLFQMRAWLDFVADSQDAEPVVAAVRDAGETVGWFTGAIVRRARLRLLGSPFPGWTTTYMGFNLRDGVVEADAIDALERFAFRGLGCVHVELRDRELHADAWESSSDPTYLLDLTKSYEQLKSEMHASTRRNLRHAHEKYGVTIEPADDLAFVDDYYDQLEDVFAKQSLVPTYSRYRVRALVEHVLPTGDLLLVRARDPDGRCIATGIFPGHGDTAYSWGGASWREHQYRRPNEAVRWEAIRWWKERGATVFDLGGAGGVYKRHYGDVREVDYPRYRRSRYRGLSLARDAAKKAFRLSLKARGRLRRAA